MNGAFSKPTVPGLIEIGIGVTLSITWILVLNSGSKNGIGYFHQPGHNLLWPLLNGTVFNAITFFGNAFWLIPCYLRERRFGSYLAGIGALAAGVLLLKTLAERIMILLAYPDLVEVPFAKLALENLWVLIVVIVLSFFYGVARDWITSGTRDSAGQPDAPQIAEQIWIKSGTSRERVRIDEILHVRASDNYVTFELEDRSLMALMSMKTALQELPGSRFIRIHRSYIIPLDKVQSVSTDTVTVDGATLPIGRTYRKTVHKRLAGMVESGSASLSSAD